MRIYIDLLLTAAILVFIVDLSGIRQTFHEAVARFVFHIKPEALRPVKPFECSLCMVWWSCLLVALCCGHLNIYTIAFSALLAFLANTIRDVLLFVREGLDKLIREGWRIFKL